MSFAYRIPKDWIKSEQQKRQLEQDKLRSELDFLKAQINPHFLFNGINSIYHMIGIDADAAKETLLQFSGLLRYQLYECSEEFISLPKELAYISNYLNIEEVRKGEDAMFTFDLPKDGSSSSLGNYKIAPLLISPFLENAFKYLSHHSDRKMNILFFKMEIHEPGILTMTLKNSHDPKIKTHYHGAGGIGLENVKRRLSILYPDGKHDLKIEQDNEMYRVELMIKLNEN
ncbi:sensor histidine kinase [Bacteroidota bacterium]